MSHVEVRPREITSEHYDYAVRRFPSEMPERLIIDGFTHKNEKWHIGINLETETIEFANWEILLQDNFDPDFVNPLILLTFPIWGSLNYLIHLSKNIFNMNPHLFFVYRKLEPQIPSEWKLIFKRALAKV